MNKIVRTLGRYSGDKAVVQTETAPAAWYGKDGAPFVAPAFRIGAGRPRPKDKRSHPGAGISSLRTRAGDKTARVIRVTERFMGAKLVSRTVEKYHAGRKTYYKRYPDCSRSDLWDDRKIRHDQ